MEINPNAHDYYYYSGMKNYLLTITLLFILSLFSLTGNAAIIHVPVDYTTIQSAILASVNGDTVLVAPGTYYENINFRGKRIVVASEFILDQNPATIDATIINGSQPVYPDTASCVLIVSGEDSTTILQGFTLTGGKGTLWRDEHNSLLYREGGGILTAFTSPTIKNNVIKNNDASNRVGASSSGGGGMRCGDGYPRIYNNIIMENAGRYGGGIVLNYCSAIIKNNIIYKNSGGVDYGGGGIWTNSNGGGGSKFIENNTIVNNSSILDGGGIVVAGQVFLKNNIFWGNTAPDGMQISYQGGSLTASYNDIQGGFSGTGNINSDPMFSDTSFYLLAGSPCIDAGDANIAYNDPEDSSNPGFAKLPSLGTVRNDIGAYGGQKTIYNPYVDLHLNDPEPPSSVSAYSDYQTPNSILLTWQDPVQLNNGQPLNGFVIHVYRDSSLIAVVDSGTQQFTDIGLNLHQQYSYLLNTAVAGDSGIFVTGSAYSGGAAIMKAPTSLEVHDADNGITLFWKNPSQQIDGTPLNDLAYVLVYRDGALIDSLSQLQTDTGLTKTYFDNIQGFHYYRIQAGDNESPTYLSASTDSILGHGGLLNEINENFEGDISSIYHTGTWDTTSAFSFGGNVSFTDSRTGNYNPNSTSYILFPPVILGNVPVLKYYDIAIVGLGSFVFIEISDDGRKTFHALKTYNGLVKPQWQDWHADPGDWVKEIIDLSAYTGDTVSIRFRMLSGSFATQDGWYIDSLLLRSYSQPSSQTMNLDSGWNMVSLPLSVTNNEVDSIFSGEIMNAFSYNAGYQKKTELENGTGYWVKLNSPHSFDISGFSIPRDTINVSAKWNLIGMVSAPIDSATITSIPSGIVTSSFYQFDEGGYTPVQTLLPGKAYWVKVSQAGKLVLSTITAAKKPKPYHLKSGK